MTPEQAFGEVIRRYRKHLSLSQEELGFKCGLDRTFIGMVERGERSPSLKTIMAIALHLNVLPSEILSDVEHKLRTYRNENQ